MAQDPGFIFYPGDYLRDTQCLSEKSQVSYDRIMCEHMRNICISQQQLKFFTKRLNEDEIEELMQVLSKNEHGYFIRWVVESINKRREYSASRRNNRKGAVKKEEGKENHISLTYDEHMDNEIENKDYNELVIIKSIMDFFNFSETANYDKMRDAGTFVKLLIHQGEIQKFLIQFEAYKKIKMKDPKFTHSFKNFIGTAKEAFLDGAWNAENWEVKLVRSIPKSGFVA